MHKKQLYGVVALATVISGVGVLQAQEPKTRSQWCLM